MLNVLFVALGGALGALARYAVSVVVVRFWAEPLPLATWTVNLLGCVLIGFGVALLQRTSVPEAGRLFFITGFLGSFTTFSTYSLETVALWQSGATGLAALNAVGSVVAGLLGVGLGMALGRLI